MREMTMKRTNAPTGRLVGILLASVFLSQGAAAQGTTQSTLLDRIQIEDMMIEYYWAFSTNEGHDIEKYWAPDGEFVLEGRTVKGLQAIKAEYGEPQSAGDSWPKFVMLLGNPMIRVTGDTAVMDAIFTGMTSTDPGKLPVPTEQGTDHVEFVKIHGQWKIKRRELGTYAYVPRGTLMGK
jgi:hypothetical protein